jgi:NitT/TauT family transport system permease protein
MMRLPGARARNALLLTAAMLLAWQALFMIAGEHALTSPLSTIASAARLLLDPGFHPHLLETAQAFVVALAIAVALGFLIGFALGLHRLANEVAEPVLIALYSIPKITLYPIVLLAFGIGISAKIAFGAMHGIVPIAIFTTGAVRNLNPIYVKTARMLRLSAFDTVRRILLPGALPEIFTGLRIGFSLTLIGTLLGEMFASKRGIGHLLMTAIGLHNVQRITAITLLLILFAVGASAVLLRIDRKLHRRL